MSYWLADFGRPVQCHINVNVYFGESTSHIKQKLCKMAYLRKDG
jgi:hypothetical protein